MPYQSSINAITGSSESRRRRRQAAANAAQGGTIRERYASGRGEAQQPGSPGFINSRATEQGRRAPISYLPTGPSDSLAEVVQPSRTAPWLTELMATASRPMPLAGVVGPGIDPGESQFYSQVAKETGLSPRVLAAQGTQEGGADDDYNVLNIGWFDSGAGALTQDPRWQNPKQAAHLTADFFKGKQFGASQGIQDILKSAGRPDHEQIAAIAGSGWATDPNYHSRISSLYGSIQGTQNPKAAAKHKEATSQLASLGVTPQTNPSLSKKPFKNAVLASQQGPSRIIDPKWDDDSDSHSPTRINSAVSPLVKKFAKKYGFTVGGAYETSGHVSPGHLEHGTATDIYPRNDNWSGKDLKQFEKGLRVLDDAGFEVGYGTDGIGEAWSNHGRGNHAHVEWLGQGTDPDAAKNLALATNKDLKRYDTFTPSAGGSASATSFTSGSGGATGGTVSDSRATPSTGYSGRTSVASNPLSARAALPQGLGGADQQATLDTLAALLGGTDPDEAEEEESISELAAILRGKRRSR